MKSQICIFVLVATVIGQSSGNQSQNTFEPGSENVTKICIIKTAQHTSISKFTKAVNIISTVMRSHMSRITDNNKNVSYQGTSSISLSKKETYRAFKQAIGLFLDTVRRLTRDYNSWADTTARRFLHEPLQMVVVNIYKALDLSVNNDYSKIQHEIQELQKATVLQATAICRSTFIAIKQGRKFSDEIQSTMDSFEEKAVDSTTHSMNFIYAAIRTSGNMSSGNKTRSEDSVLAMENYQTKAISTLTSLTEYEYASIKFLYVTLCMDQMDMSTTLAVLNSQQEEANRKTKQGLDIIVSVIKSIASNAMEANRNKMENQSCINEIAENEVYEAWLKAVDYLLDSNTFVQAVKPSIDRTSRLIITNGLKDIVRITFEGIKAAQNESYVECMLQLDRLRNEKTASDLMLTKGLYMAVRNCRNDSDKMTKMINHAHDRSVPYVINGTTGIFHGIKFLANFLSESKDSRHDDWSALDTAASKAYSVWTKEIDFYYELLHSLVVSSSMENYDMVSYLFPLRSAEDIAISEFCKGIRLIFTKMETDLKNMPPKNNQSPRGESKQHSSLHLNNLPTHENYKNEATVAIKNALNATMDLLATTGLVNSSVIKSSFSALVVATIDIIGDIFQLIDSAMGEECNENVSDMYDTESSLTTQGVAFFKYIIDVFRSGQKNGSDKNKAIIKQAESETISNSVNAVHALYRGIEIFKTAIELGIQGGSKDSFSALKAAETEVCSALKANFKIIFTLIQTLLISSYSKSNRISTMIAEIQSAHEITAGNCQKGLGIILKSMTRDVANTTCMHQTENQPNILSPTSKNEYRQFIKSYPVANLTYHTFKTAVDGFFNLIPKIQPEATAIVETVRPRMYMANKQFVEDIFFAIELIHCNFSSEVLAEIDRMEKSADRALTGIIESYYIPMEYDLEPGTETYRYVEKAKTVAITLILKTWMPIFTGLRILFYESFPALDDGYRAHLPSMDVIENESRFYMKAVIRTVYDTVMYKFVHFPRNYHEMLDTTCPSTGL